jgi:hypothetical protein
MLKLGSCDLCHISAAKFPNPARNVDGGEERSQIEKKKPRRRSETRQARSPDNPRTKSASGHQERTHRQAAVRAPLVRHRLQDRVTVMNPSG